MPSFIPQPGELHDIELRELSDHPLLAPIPTWPRDSAEFAALLESIRDHGLDYPLLVDTAFQLIDGRNRRNALAVLGGLGGAADSRVPCKFVAQEAAAGTIISTLADRHHITKGAIAYLAFPLIAPAMADSKARFQRAQAERMRQGLISDSIGNKSKMGPPRQTMPEFAARLAVAQDTLEQARKLHGIMDALSPEQRAKYEPRVLGLWQDEVGTWHEPVGLGYMINGLTSLRDGKASTMATLVQRNDHARLCNGALDKVRLHWGKATAEQRAEIEDQMREDLRSWPAELVERLARLSSAATRYQARQAIGT